MNENEHLSEEQIFNHFLDTLDGCEDAELGKRIQAQPEAMTIFKGFESMHGQLQQMRVMTLTPGGISPRNNTNLPKTLGNYKILGKIGEGGMGVVLKAFDPSLGRVVAIKLLKNHKAKALQQQRFRREAQTIARLRHDNIVQIFALEFNDVGEPFIVMEYLQGQSLRREVNPTDPWTPEELQASWRPLLEALGHAHKKGILHRDIKPDNLLRERDRQQIKIVDFGLSKWSNDDIHLTGEGLTLGTMPYMAPEQLRGESMGESGDIYSLAVTMAEMIMGERPFKARNPVKLLEEISRGLPLSVLKSASPWVHKIEWLNLLQDCCHPQAEKRPKGEVLLLRLRELEQPSSATKIQDNKTRNYSKLSWIIPAILVITGVVMLVLKFQQNPTAPYQQATPVEAHLPDLNVSDNSQQLNSIQAHTPDLSLSVVLEQNSGLKPELSRKIFDVLRAYELQGGYRWGQGPTKCRLTCDTQGDRLVLKLQLNGPKLNVTKIVEQALVVEIQPSLDSLMISINAELSKNPFQ